MYITSCLDQSHHNMPCKNKLDVLYFVVASFTWLLWASSKNRSCRGGCMEDPMGWLKRGGGSRALVVSRGEVDMRERGTQDIPRFGALRRDNTPSLAERGLYVDGTSLLLELFWGGRKTCQGIGCSLSLCGCSTDRLIVCALSVHGGLLGDFVGQSPGLQR